MNNNVSIFERVLQKLSFRTSIEDNVKTFALSYKRKALEVTLKNFGDYTFTYDIALRFYFFIKRTGYSLSIVQCKIILVAVSALIALAASSGIYFSLAGINTIKNPDIYPADTVTEEIRETSLQTSKVTDKAENINNLESMIKAESVSPSPAETIKTRIGIETFSGTAVDEKTLESITDKISGRLTELAGKQKITRLNSSRKNSNVNLLLTGSVEKLGSTYIINSRLINIENSEVVFVTSEEVKDIDKIDQACLNIAEKTASAPD